VATATVAGVNVLTYVDETALDAEISRPGVKSRAGAERGQRRRRGCLCHWFAVTPVSPVRVLHSASWRWQGRSIQSCASLRVKLSVSRMLVILSSTTG
jgi:hypothetical protein